MSESHSFEYSTQEMSKAILNTYPLPMNADLMAQFPLLKKLSGFEMKIQGFSDVEKNKVIRYINYFYSQSLTCIRERYDNDINKVKAECARISGFVSDPNTGEFSEKVTSFLLGENLLINRMIVSFVKHNYSDRYSVYAMMRDQLFYMLNNLQNIEDPAKVDKIFSIEEKLDKLQAKLLNGDSNAKIKVALEQRLEEVSLGLRPEDVAHRISEGKKPIDFEVYE